MYDRYMTKRPTLPNDEVAFLKSLSKKERNSRLRALHLSGWSLGSLGDSLTPKRPKTTVHFWVANAEDLEQRRSLPEPPPKSFTTSVPTPKAPRLRTISPTVPPDLRNLLQELSREARKYRAKTSPNSLAARANAELTKIALELRSLGVPTADIAEAAGVTYRAMARRVSQKQDDNA